MKKLLCMLLAVLMIASLSVTAFAAENPEVTLVYAEVNPADDSTPVGQMAVDFKTKVEEISGGSIKIDLQASGVLGSEAQVLDGILGGSEAVDISRISAFALNAYGCTKATLLSLPYVFVSREHYWNFANSELAQEFLNEPQEIGLPLRGICYGEEGFRHFFFKDPVDSIDDLKGMQIRVSDDPVMNGMVNGLGANPTVVSFTELYSALQTGVVDAAEQPIANYKSNSFQEVAPNLLLDGHTMGAIQLVITDNAWNKLTEEQQGWIMEAAKYASEQNAKNSENAENAVLEELIADGINVVEVEDKTPWIEACTDIVSQYTGGDMADYYQQILDMAP